MLVAAAVTAGGWFCMQAPSREVVKADPSPLLIDSDDDFLPDCIEWTVLTNPLSADTDGDSYPDFVEVVQRGTPRQPGTVRAFDHEMRAVVTAPAMGQPGPTWLHLLFRFVGDTTQLSSFQTWLELPALPGIHVPLDVLGVSGIDFAQRATANQGLWVRLSIPMVSEAMLRYVLPCTIRASATIGGRTIETGVKLFDAQGTICTLVPFNRERLALQSIGQVLAPSSLTTNRVCLLMLERVGSGPGGDVFEVVSADCSDCNELECGASCPQSVGWIFSIPGGLETITGG